jgi:hypothetical protein
VTRRRPWISVLTGFILPVQHTDRKTSSCFYQCYAPFSCSSPKRSASASVASPVWFSRAGDRASSDFPCRQEAVGIYFVAAFSVLASGTAQRDFHFLCSLLPGRVSCLDPSRVFLLLGRHSAPASHFAGRFWDPLRFCFLL